MLRGLSIAVGVGRSSFAIYLILRAIFGPVLWPFSVIEPLLLWLCMPSFALLIIALVRRRWSPAAAHAVIAGAWLSIFGHFLIPPPSPPSTSGPALEVLSFNVGAGVASYEQIVKLLRVEAADLVLIQELTADQEHAFAHDLLELYPHRDLHGLGIDGMGIFSKHPIVEAGLLQLDSRRAYQRAVIDVRGQRMTVFNVHPGLSRLLFGPSSRNPRDFQRMALDARAAGAAIIAGDFNATENMDLCQLLEVAGLRDAFRDAGRGFGLTFPVFRKYRGLPIPAFVRIDYVWYTESYACRAARVLEDAGSDHLPLSVVLERR
ncbi:MAG: endonuclease/exonuclease/phosphatase family protein [Planctomycetota bacterium]